MVRCFISEVPLYRIGDMKFGEYLLPVLLTVTGSQHPFLVTRGSRQQGAWTSNRSQTLRLTFYVQGYLAHKKTQPSRTLLWDYAWGPLVALGGWRFLISEVPL